MCREKALMEDASSSGYSAYGADIWAAAICLWIFLFESLPFYSIDIGILFTRIREEELPSFPVDITTGTYT